MLTKSLLPKSPKIYLSLVAFFLILFFLMPRQGKFNYDYKKGSPWTYETLVADFDFPLLKTKAQIETEKQAVSSSIIPYYKYNPEIANQAITSIDNLNLSGLDKYKSKIISELNNIYLNGLVDDNYYPKHRDHVIGEQIVFIQKDRRAIKYPASHIFSETMAENKLKTLISKFNVEKSDSILTANNFWSFVKPNLSYDKETTDLVHANAIDYISPTSGYIKAGTVIVSHGELVTSEIVQMLDSYKKEFEENFGYSGSVALLWCGNFLIAMVMCLILFLAILYTSPSVFQEVNKFLYIMFILGMATVVTVILDRINPTLLYLMPFTVFVLYMMAFLKKRVVMPVYIISLLPLLIFAHNGVELFIMNLVAGVMVMYSFQFFNKGLKQFISALVIFFAMALTYLGFKFINETNSLYNWYILLYIFIGSFLVVAAYPFISLFEKIFGLLSDSKLIELSDTNNKLLLDLSQKAPGTFQHSLQVMNMCGEVARNIGADELLVRVGALYHDIGKMENPQCFVENQNMGFDYHKNLTPFESARDIIKHVTDGMALADKYNLPNKVKEFIITHHGTTCVAYFYNKYVNDGGDVNDKPLFCYPGIKPQTKEHVILMVCDTLEAASRTLKDTSAESFNVFVDKVVAHKLEEGQFDEADITWKELSTMKAILKKYLTGIYHERIVYPTRKR